MNDVLNKVLIAGSGGGEEGHKAVEDPDSLQSSAIISILDLIGEGQIGGLVDGNRSIFFNDTPLENADGSKNFNGVTPVFRDGTQAQEPIPGFADVETPHVVGVQVKQNLPSTITITNPNADAVNLVVMVSALLSQDKNNGDTHGTEVKFKFDMSVNDGAFAPLSGDLTITGKTRSRYQRSYRYDLPKTATNGLKAVKWTIRMTRITEDPKPGENPDFDVHNDTYFDSYTEIVNSKLSYPNSALIGITIDAAQFNEIPNRAYLVDGLFIQVPSNYNAVTRTYSGIWNGTLKPALSSNPAWVLYDLLTNARYGLGRFVSPAYVDKAKLYQIGRYCDELVPDGFGGMEPRFTLNTAIQTQAEAFKLVSDLTSVFRGMGFWNGSMIGFSQDCPTDPSMVYNSANVIGGLFNYTGSSRKDRHSVVLVTWNDPKNNHKQVIEYVEDADLIAKFGVRKLDVIAFGCTSRGQANRVGRWILYTEAYESNMINFRVGIDSAMVTPGEVVKIHDTSRAGKRMGGRLVASTRTSATLDAPITLSSTGTISIRMPDGTFAERMLAQKPSSTASYTTVTWAAPLPDDPLPNAIWLVGEDNLEPMLARVVGISQGDEPGTFTITALEHNPSKYDAIEKDLKLEPAKTSLIDVNSVTAPADCQVYEVPYQVAPGVLGLSLNVSWTGQASFYEITWKRSGKYPTNSTTQTTSLPMLDLENVRAGDYSFSIVAVNAFGRRSQPTTLTHTTVGKTAAPGDVINFQITKRTSDLLLTWDQVTDINLLGYEVRVGASWDAGSVITTRFAGTMITHDQDNAGDYYYHIRSINMDGDYSENVTTAKLTLVAPATPQSFDVIQSGSRLELNWRPNTETDLVYYEIREGNSWNTGTLISQAKATSFTIPSGGIGVRKFWIKAVSSPGIYSEVAAWIDTNIAMPTNSNIVANFDEKALNWPGNKVNMHTVGYDLMMNTGVARSEYVFPVDLLDSYRAQNSIYATLDSVVFDTDAMTWTSSGFDWSANEALRHWAPGGDIDSVIGKYQIARKTGLRSNEIDGWRLNDSLTSVAGKTPNNAVSVTYQPGRFGDGVRLKGGVKVDWTSVAIPAQFRYTFWIIPKLVGSSAEVSVLSLVGGSKELRLGYREIDSTFMLIDQAGRTLEVPLAIATNDVIAVSIVQTATKRKLFVAKLGGDPVSAEIALPPEGAFSELRLYWG